MEAWAVIEAYLREAEGDDEDDFERAHRLMVPGGGSQGLPRYSGMSGGGIAGQAKPQHGQVTDPNIEVPKAGATQSTIQRRLGISPDAYFGLADTDARKKGRPTKGVAGHDPTSGELPKVGATAASDTYHPARPGDFHGQSYRPSGYSSLHPMDYEVGQHVAALLKSGDKAGAKAALDAKRDEGGPDDRDAALWVSKNLDLAKRLQRGNPSAVDPKRIGYGNMATGQRHRRSHQPSVKGGGQEWRWDQNAGEWVLPGAWAVRYPKVKGAEKPKPGPRGPYQPSGKGVELPANAKVHRTADMPSQPALTTGGGTQAGWPEDEKMPVPPDERERRRAAIASRSQVPRAPKKSEEGLTRTQVAALRAEAACRR